MSKKPWLLALLILSLVLVLSACSWNPFKKKAAPAPIESNQPTIPGNNTASSTEENAVAKKFANLDELQKFLADKASSSGISYRGSLEMTAGGAGIMASKAVAPAMAQDTNTSISTALVAGQDYSTTNIQVAGVDEGDIIKSDGNYIYALVYNDLYIVKAQPATDAQIISKITFQSRPADLYISGDRLIIFGMDNQIYTTKLYESFKRRGSFAFLKVFDIADRKNPKVLRDLEFEGSYIDSRLIGNYLYFITNNYSYYAVGEPLLPRVLNNGQLLPEKCDISGNNCYTPDVYYFNLPYDSYNFTSVTAVNINDNNEAIAGQTYLLDGTQTIYASAKNIYLTYTKYLDEYGLQQDMKRALAYDRLSNEEKDKINKIEATENFILSLNEKKAKVSQVIDAFLNTLSDADRQVFDDSLQAHLKEKYAVLADQLEQTYIHKIALDGRKLDYKGFGQVNGQVLNQFSLDENNGYLRVATTKNRSWTSFRSEEEQQSYSNLFVLDENLKLVGGLVNLATTERIYAARFMGNRAYVVTFKQTDPIYVIDLSDPKNLKILATLKIPGFSNYIHPYDENGTKLIGLGRDTEEDAAGNVKIKGIKLSFFDFSDLSKPKESSSYVIGSRYSDSVALYDHHAFLFSRNKNILSLPVSLVEEKDGVPGATTFSGALVFNVNNDKFELKGRIDHSSGGKYNQSDNWNGFNYYDNSVKRSLYINDDLYTFSNKFLMVNSLKTASGTDPLPLEKQIEFNSTPINQSIPMPLSASTGVSGASAGSAGSGSSGQAAIK